MTADVGATTPDPTHRVTTNLVLWSAAAVAWIATIVWAASRDMGAMPGTMELGFATFVGMWAVMMAAMMLPSVSPFVGTYARTVRTRRVPRLFALAVGYLGA